MTIQFMLKAVAVATLVLAVPVLLSGCSTSTSANSEQKIRQEERIRADEQQKIQVEQKSKNLDNELTQRGVDVKHIEDQAKSYGMDPNTTKEYVKSRLDNVFGKITTNQ